MKKILSKHIILGFVCLQIVLYISSCQEKEILVEEIQSQEKAIQNLIDDTPFLDAGVFNTTSTTKAAQECCTEVGKMDECWWEDAINDGITCTVATQVSDCASNQCYVEPGFVRGVCKCSSQAQCNNGGKRQGICHEKFIAEASSRVCGPSYCNGYLKCSCYGSCEWWHEDENYTPAMEADNSIGLPYPAGDGLYCCEGSYPLGGPSAFAYYSNVDNCDDDVGFVIPTCTTNSDCDNGLECTTDTCVAGSCHHVSNTGAACGIGSLECSAGVCNSYGVCEESNFSAGTACGDTHGANPCQNSDACDGLGNCLSNNFVVIGTLCGGEYLGNECRNQDECDGLGLCLINNFVPDGTACGDENALNDCLNQDVCQGGFCVNDYVAVGTPCGLDPLVFPPSCYEGLCGLLPVGPDNGVCQPQVLVPANDTCAGAVSLGHFGANETGSAAGSAAGALECAQNNYNAFGQDCFEWATANRLGYATKDLVYSFTYDTPNTTSEAIHQQYAFIVRVESDVAATVFTYSPADNACPAEGAVASNRCISQHRGDNTGNFYVFEHMANTQGNSWHNPPLHSSQACSSTAGTGYWWCERGGWNYPDDITPCEEGTCNVFTSYPQANISQAVVFPRGPMEGGTHTVYVFVDGAGAAGGAHDNGIFEVSVEKIELNNGPCERINDDPRVYDITEVEPGGSYYLGNFENVANSLHEKISDQACGGFDCAGDWLGVTANHFPPTASANEFWPNSVHYKIHRPLGSGAQQYCIRTEDANVDSTPAVIALRAMDDPNNICGGTHADMGSAYGSNGLNFMALEGVLYKVMVSEYNERTDYCVPGDNDCNFKLVVEEGPCPVVDAITADLDCISKPVIGNFCTAMGVTGTRVAGRIMASEGDAQYVGNITEYCDNVFDFASSTWPGKNGPDTVVLLVNDTLVDKEVVVEFWDHEMCNVSNCAPQAQLYSVVFSCEGALIDWTTRIDNTPGKAVAPGTCVPANVHHTEHTIVIPAGETYQFIATAWDMGNISAACDATWDPIDGMGYHLDVTWTDTVYVDPGQGVCGVSGYEFPVGSGICWYKGNPSLDCNSVCMGYDGCSLASMQTYAQNLTTCEMLIDNLWDITTGGVTSLDVEGSGVGCVIRNYGLGTQSYHVDTQAVTCGASASNISRVCACTTPTGAVECTPGQTRCNGSTFQVCAMTGHWVDDDNCSYGCNASTGCYGECSPFTNECVNSSNYRTCGADYMWGASAACPYYCDQGGTENCAGECVLGNTRCTGNVFEECILYAWTSTSCAYACNATTGCYGECTPGETVCADANNAVTCQGDYTWGANEFCPGGCLGGVCQITSGCDPGGVEVGGYCWHASAVGGNCTNACSAHGGYNEATRTYAGGGGTNAQCQAVLAALGVGNTGHWHGSQSWNTSYGCGSWNGTSEGIRMTGATTAGAAVTDNIRVCACVNGSQECPNAETWGCMDSSTRAYCSAAHTWVTPSACPYYCNSATGNCEGECTPGATECTSGSQVRTCGSDYMWGAATTCPGGVCSGGACAGCQPAACASAATVSPHWSYDGTGPGCVFFTSGGYINTWSGGEVRINGGSARSGWFNNFGDTCNGGYYMEYWGPDPWSHVEIGN